MLAILDPTVDEDIIIEERLRIKEQIRSFNPETPYYVYSLNFPDGTPFYIGKGKGMRGFVHFKDYTKNKLKKQIIQRIIDAGSYPILSIDDYNLTEEEAFRIEEEYIVRFGRYGIDKGGILTNQLPGGKMCPTDDDISSLGGHAAKRMGCGIFSSEWDRGAQSRKNWENGAYDNVDFISYGKINGSRNFINQVGIHNPKYKEKRSEWASASSKAMHTKMRETDPDKYSENQAHAGKFGGKFARDNNLGIFSMTEEAKTEARSKGGKTLYETKQGMFKPESVERRAEKTRKRVIIEGRIFNSMSEVAEHYGKCQATITYRVNSDSERWKNWNFYGETK